VQTAAVTHTNNGYNRCSGERLRGDSMTDQDQQKPVVIQQGGNGVGLVLAALIVGGAIVYSVNVWSNTQQQKLRVPAEAIQKGVETVKDAIKPGS
jgi:hypothetical protein